jgi:hypothetical protein
MADQVLTNLKFMLHDLWPGRADERRGVPTDGFTGTSHHNVTEAVGLAAGYRVGDKRQVRNITTGLEGLSTFIYLKLSNQDATNILAARHLVVRSTAVLPYSVTNEVATELANQTGPAAIALSAMGSGATPAVCGWFWCGGVAPIDFVAAMEGDFYTLNTVTAGCTLTWNTLATPGLVAGEIGFDIANYTTAPEAEIGFAFAADA